jgi:uroporphyrinogen-III decarboxylase
MPTPNQRPIRWAFLIPVEVQCEYTGIPQGAYYTDLAKTIAVCEQYPERFEAATGYRPPLVYSTPVTAYEGVAALGGDLLFPDEHQPMIRNQGRVLTFEQIDALTVPDPWRSPRFQRHVAWHRELKRRFGDLARPGVAGQEGPVTTAGLLRGPDFLLDCLVDPARAHRLLDVCTETFIRWTRVSQEVDGLLPGVIGIADDYAGMLGPDLWPEFVLPYYRCIIEALGPQGCWMHTELVRRAHLPLLRQLKLTGLNFSENQYLTPQDVFEECPGVPFGWHILTVAEMQQGTPASIQARYREIVAAGVDEVRCELTVHTPPANVRAFLEIARALEQE